MYFPTSVAFTAAENASARRRDYKCPELGRHSSCNRDCTQLEPLARQGPSRHPSQVRSFCLKTDEACIAFPRLCRRESRGQQSSC